MARAHQRSRLDLDDHLVALHSGAEIVEGRLVVTPGADPPHATHHSRLAFVLEAHVAPGWRAAVDLLTRVSSSSDLAPDASVFPADRDPITGGRGLEAIAVEIAGTQPLRVVSSKARALAARGVRRILCVVVRTGRVLDWDARTSGFRALATDDVVIDRSLARPLPVRALLDAAAADEAVMEALAVRHPERDARLAARARVLAFCELLGIRVTPARSRALASMDAAALRRLGDAIQSGRGWPRRRA